MTVLGRVAEESDRIKHIDRPLSLAYIGDAVWELYVRRHLLADGFSRPNDLQKQAVRYVSAKAQAAVLEELLPLLSEAEQDVVRRGRNTKSKTAPKNTAVVDYRLSTGIEALVGYLYLTDQLKRLAQLMRWVFDIIEAEGNARDE